MTWHTVCKVDELPKGQLKAFAAGDEKVVVYHLEDGFYATQANCTHVFAPLSKGKIIDGCKIQCPFHRARFDIKSGEVVDWANFPPGIQVFNIVRGEKALKTYKVELKGKDVRVRVS
jgi:3-phenylpropionate/trans-cinnamate dioxygenase ferredoxin component